MGALAPRRIQVWWGRPDQLGPACLARHADLLPADERAAVARFAFEEDRHESLLARVMVRQVLAQIPGGLPPDVWTFSRTPLGRPFITNAGFDEVSFSLSHTRSLVVVALTARAELGVDVESLVRRAPLHLADRYFAGPEAADLRRMPLELRERRFFDYWTLKEAFIKARGLGLTLPLDTFWFQFPSPGAVAIEFCQELAASGESAGRWRFHLGELAPAHALAVACATDGGEPIEVTFHPVAPLLACAET